MSRQVDLIGTQSQVGNRLKIHPIVAALCALALTGCGGASSGGGKTTATSFTIGGTVSGLVNGDSVVLVNSYGNGNTTNQTASANGPFTFQVPLANGTSYSVSIGTQPVGEQCTVANGGSTVAAANVTNVAVTCAATSYKVSAVVTGLTNVSGLVLQDNGGDDLTVSSSGTLQFATGLTTGQAYDVTIQTQPAGHTCAVLSPGSGTIVSANVSVTVVCPWHVGYVGAGYQAGSTLGSGNSIDTYYIDQSTGATTAGAVTSSGKDPWSIAVSPTAGFLYADNEIDNTVSGYSIDPSNGSLDPVPGSPFSVGTALSSAGPYPHSIAVDPQGHFVYVLDWQGDIVAFGINSSTGALTALSTTTLPASAIALTVSSHNVLYAIGALNNGDAEVAAYAVNTSTGALTAVSGSPFAFAPPTGSMDGFTGYGWNIDPKARFFYLTFTQEGSSPQPVGAYTVASIDATTGALTPVSGSPFALTHAVDSISIDNTGTYLYGGNSYENLIQEFSIDQTTGLLTEFATEDLPGQIDSSIPYLSGIDPSNSYLFCSQTPYSPYSIDPTTGTLTEFLNGSTTSINNAVPVAFSNTP